MIQLYDAHCHLPKANAHASVINGTKPSDWPDVLKAAEQHEQIIPAIGLHPWQVNDAPDDWQATFLEHIADAQAVGEIGLDRWIEGYDIDRQEAAFGWQLEQAAERNLPVSVHCLKATEPLLRILRACPRPKRGIHLHAYSGSAEQVSQLAELGAYFSFHAGQFEGNAKKAPAAIRAIPADRLLIETDAPDTLDDGNDYAKFLQRGYQRVAELRGVSIEALATQAQANFQKYFIHE